MTFTKILQNLKSFFYSGSDPWSVTEFEYEEYLRKNPEIGKESRLTSAVHALKTGIPEKVVAAAFPVEVDQLRKKPDQDSCVVEDVSLKVDDRVKAANRYYDQSAPRAHSQAELDFLFKRND